MRMIRLRLSSGGLGLIAGVLALMSASGVGARDCTSLEAVDWVLGEWTTSPERTVTRESWVRVSDTTFEGEGVTTVVPDGSIVNHETLRLVSMSDGVFYVAKVSENDLPVSFRLTSCEDGFAVFENPAHDAPQRIVYRLVRSSRLGHALEIEVRVGGGDMQEFSLVFTRP